MHSKLRISAGALTSQYVKGHKKDFREMCLKGCVAILWFEIRLLLPLGIVMSHVIEGNAERITSERAKLT